MAVAFSSLSDEAKELIVSELNKAYLDDPDIKYFNTLQDEIFRIYKDSYFRLAPRNWPEALTPSVVTSLYSYGIFNEFSSTAELIKQLKRRIYNYICAARLYEKIKASEFFKPFNVIGADYTGSVSISGLDDLGFNDEIDHVELCGYLNADILLTIADDPMSAFSIKTIPVSSKSYFVVKFFDYTTYSGTENVFNSEVVFGIAFTFELHPAHPTPHSAPTPCAYETTTDDFTAGRINAWLQSHLTDSLNNFVSDIKDL